jgi:hypothetical protein
MFVGGLAFSNRGDWYGAMHSRDHALPVHRLGGSTFYSGSPSVRSPPTLVVSGPGALDLELEVETGPDPSALLGSIRGFKSPVRTPMAAISAADGEGGRIRTALFMSSADQLLLLPSRLRAVTATMISHPVFDGVILALILLNCVVLGLDEPGMDPGSKTAAFVRVTGTCRDVVSKRPASRRECLCCGWCLDGAGSTLIALFAVEALLKIAVKGVFREATAYFRDGWNVLDFVVTLEGVVSLFSSASSALVGLRTLRVLRPLRTLSRFKSLRVLTLSITRSVPMLCSTLMLCVYFFIIFGVIGIQVCAISLRRSLGDLQRAGSDSLPPPPPSLVLSLSLNDPLRPLSRSFSPSRSSLSSTTTTAHRCLPLICFPPPPSSARTLAHC